MADVPLDARPPREHPARRAKPDGCLTHHANRYRRPEPAGGGAFFATVVDGYPTARAGVRGQQWPAATLAAAYRAGISCALYLGILGISLSSGAIAPELPAAADSGAAAELVIHSADCGIAGQQHVSPQVVHDCSDMYFLN
jgi:hypothetical protein